MEGDRKMAAKEVVIGQQGCQTKEARWLCIEDAHAKFHRANLYDIGGTYVEDINDFWFMFKTEQIGEIFLLHLFVNSHQEGNFSIALSETNQLRHDSKTGKAYLSKYLREFPFQNVKERSQTYIKTFNFSDLDVEFMAEKKLYIKMSISKDIRNKEMFESVKAKYDLGALLTYPIGADFIIEAADGKKFKVHKAVLTAQSEVFKAMLKEDTAESQNSIVKIIDVTSEDLQSLIEFFYTGTVKDVVNSNFINLLILADRYNLNNLSEFAEYALSQQLTSDNALEILVVADMYNSQILKCNALKFIKKNASVLRSTMFNEIKNPQLLRELCTYLVPLT